MTTRTLLLLSVVLAAAQDDVNSKARALVQKLRSESIEERDGARKGLIELGKAALPALREAVRDPDAEVARSVGLLIRRLEFLEKLTPRLLKHFPGVETRLAAGGDPECLAVFLEALPASGRTPFPLTRTDLDPLAGPALRGAASDDEFQRLCETIWRQKLKGAAADLRVIMKENPARAGAAAYALHFLVPVSVEEVAPLLKGNDRAQWTAAHVLDLIGGEEAKKALRSLDSGTDPSAKVRAAAALHRMGDVRPLLDVIERRDADTRYAIEYVTKARVREAAPALLRLIGKPDLREFWTEALGALAALRAAEAVPRAIQLLGERHDVHVREAAANVLFAAGTAKEAPHVRTLLNDSYQSVQLAGVKAAVAWNARDAIPTLQAHAKNDKSSIQAAAIEALGALKDRLAIPDLLDVLNLKEASEAKTAAVKALAALDAREAVPVIAGMIDDGSWSNGYHVVHEALRELGAHEQILSIVKRLGDPSPRVRSSILSVVSSFRWTQAAPEIAKLLTDVDPGVQIKAIWTLKEMNAVEHYAEIEKLLAEGGEHTAYPALMTLGRLDPARAQPLVLRFLTHDKPMIRNNAIFWLAKRGDAQGLEALEKLASEPGDYVNAVRETVVELPPEVRPRFVSKLLGSLRKKWQYIDRLAPLADPETHEIWAALLNDKDPEARAGAISLVLSTGNKKFVPRVRALIEDPDPKVRAAALSSLAARGFREIAPDVKERLFDVDYMVRLSALGAVQSLELTEAVPDLEEYLVSDSLPFMSPRVLHVLGQFKSRASVPRIQAMLRHPDPYNIGVRTSALYALSQIGDASVLGDVVALLDDPQPGVRGAAARTLAHLGGEAYADQIESLLRNPEAEVRAAAIDGTRQLRGARAIPLFEPLLKDSSTSVKNSAAIALLRLGSTAGVPRIMHNSEYSPWYSFNILNGARQPELYSRLSEARFARPLRGPVRDVVASLLAPLGIKLDDSGVQGEAWRKFSAAPASFDPTPGHDSAKYVLEMLLDYPFGFVLEKDRLRILTSEQARAFWKAWWADRQGKK